MQQLNRRFTFCFIALQDKAKQKAKEKIVEDKTFGLKNKGKSAKVQKYVQQLQKSAQPQRNPRLEEASRKVGAKDNISGSQLHSDESVRTMGGQQAGRRGTAWAAGPQAWSRDLDPWPRPARPGPCRTRRRRRRSGRRSWRRCLPPPSSSPKCP